MDSILLYFRYLRQSILSQLQYRVSFILQSIGHFLVTGIEFLGVWALFDRFGGLRDWSLPEVALFYGAINVAFACADALGRGFDVFPTQIRNGGFDRVLLRPRSTMLQIFGHELTLRRIGRVAQGLAVLIYAVLSLGLVGSPLALFLVLEAIVGAAALFLGLYVIQATVAFWTVESLEVMNTVTYGGVETAQYPMSVYRRWFQRFFTFVVPLSAVSYFPLARAMGRSPAAARSLAWIAPLAGVLFFLGSFAFWRYGVRHYTSTGS